MALNFSANCFGNEEKFFIVAKTMHVRRVKN